MTTIIGVQYEDGFILAADSITNDTRSYEHKDIKKITEVGDYVLAGAGNSRYTDVITYGWQPPIYDNSEPYSFMVSKFIPEMRRAHEETGYNLKDDEGFEFIVGLKNNLYYIAGDYSVLRTNTNIYGIGSGVSYAIGAFTAGATIQKSVRIASKYDLYTGGKVQIVKRGKVNG